MMGLEKLLAAMTGMSQEEMKAVAQQGVTVLATVDTRLTNMERMIGEIHAAVTVAEPVAVIEHKPEKEPKK